MGKPARKLNFVIEETICRDLEDLIPAGKRSKVVNDALRKELELIRRKKAVEKILTSPVRGKQFSNQDILKGLARDRSAH